MAARRAAPALLLALLAGCGGHPPAPTPESAVRAAAHGYVDALRDGRWAEACAHMTAAARAAVTESGASCAEALAAGGALPRATLDTVARQLDGARVRIAAGSAVLGPVGDLPAPLRFVRRDGRWLLAR